MGWMTGQSRDPWYVNVIGWTLFLGLVVIRYLGLLVLIGLLFGLAAYLTIRFST